MSTILHKIAKSGVHVLIGAKSGDGATTTLLGLIEEIHKIDERCQFFIVSPVKQQKWLGLEYAVNQIDGESAVYPAVVYPFGIDIDVAISQIEVVHKILTRRKKSESTESLRVELIINEWSSLYGALGQCNRAVHDLVLSMLNEIIVAGRQFNIRLILQSQSLGVADTGITSTLRKNFTTFVQERTNKNYQGNAISKVVQDASMVDPTEVSRLNQELAYIHKAATDEWQFVAIVVNLGKPMTEVLPDLSQIRDTVIFSK